METNHTVVKSTQEVNPTQIALADNSMTKNNLTPGYNIPPMRELVIREVEGMRRQEPCVILTYDDLEKLRGFFCRAWETWPGISLFLIESSKDPQEWSLMPGFPTFARLLEIPHESEFEKEFKDLLAHCINTPGEGLTRRETFEVLDAILRTHRKSLVNSSENS